MSNTLSRMETFARVAEERSFSRAARRLGLSKGAVSKTIAALEAELGARLLERSTRQVTLTEAGELFLTSCQQIVSEAERAERLVRELNDVPSGVLRVNTATAFANRWIAPAMPEFFARYPQVSVELEGDDKFVDVHHGGWDVVVRVGRLVDSTLIARKLAPVRVPVIASPEYLARHGEPTRPEQLRDHECALYKLAPQPDRWTLERRGKKVSVKVGGHLTVNNDLATLNVLLAGFAIGILPEFIIADELRTGRLRVILPGWELPPLVMHALMPPARANTAKVRAFVDFLVERFASEFWHRGAKTATP
jgi:DNA-binding transcriptional LysR family regulator